MTEDPTMDEADFRRQAQVLGLLDIEFKDYPPHQDGPVHTHDVSVMLLVVRGEFSLARENSAVTYPPGRPCELAAGVSHTERTGAAGGRVLLAKKRALAWSMAESRLAGSDRASSPPAMP